MSAQRRGKNKTADRVTVAPAEPTVQLPPLPRNRPAMIAALSLWLSCLAGLVALAALSSNPVTLNLKQINDSTVIVSGQVADSSQGTVAVSNVVAGELDRTQIEVDNLNRLSDIKEGQSYIFPLRKKNGGFEVANIPSLPPRPVIYPDTPEVQQKLAEILHAIDEQSFP